jgi:hypothetical protein
MNRNIKMNRCIKIKGSKTMKVNITMYKSRTIKGSRE